MFSNLAAIASLMMEVIRLIEDCVTEANKKEQLNQLEDAFRAARTKKDTTQLTNLVNSIVSGSK